jgi:hypothetical protein
MSGPVRQSPKGEGGWSRAFDDPIPLPRGRELATLEEAARHIMKLPKAEQQQPRWQLAARILIAAAEGRDFAMHARIAMAKALDLPRPAPEPGRQAGEKGAPHQVIKAGSSIESATCNPPLR